MSIDLDEYCKKQHLRVSKNYQTKHAAFGGRIELADWYVKKLKEQVYECHYCKTSIHTINELIDSQKLRVRKVRGDGRRGPVLEIDKQGEKYDKDNCVLACYYCNNDKSYTASKEVYEKYFGKDRQKYFEILRKELHSEK